MSGQEYCAVVERGKIIGIAPVSIFHVFGDRDTYSHVKVEMWSELPDEYNDTKMER